MSELKTIIAAYDTAEAQGYKTVLATVVKVEGSSYRMPGARMLVSEYGEMTGAISGGCLEGDALRRAMLALQQQTNKVVTYDTTNEADATVGIQLGCNGIVHILFEYIDPNDPQNPITLLKKIVHIRVPALVVTICSLDRYAEQPGTCGIRLENETVLRTNPLIAGEDMLAYMEQVSRSKATMRTVLEYKNVDYELLLEYHIPPIHMVLVGAGNDAQPVAAMAAMLGWEVSIVDGRASHAAADRFTAAKQVITAAASEFLHHIDIDSYTAVVLMSHNFNYDKDVLQQLLQTSVSYIGLLGPKKRFQRLLNALQEDGCTIEEPQQAKMHGPVGLDIGAETSAEIALSIIAEVKSFLHRRSAASLRDRTAKMHENIPIL